MDTCVGGLNYMQASANEGLVNESWEVEGKQQWMTESSKLPNSAAKMAATAPLVEWGRDLRFCRAAVLIEHTQSEAPKAMKLAKPKGNWICTDPVRKKVNT